MAIGIFGGTFNPVHWGHIRTAVEIKNALVLEKMLLLPCGMPPHREQPEVSSEMRLEMLKLAVKDFPELEIDDRELKRKGPSYSVDTLQSLRTEMPEKTFALSVGADAFLYLNTWHQWRKLFDLAHIIVAHRPGWSVDEVTEKLPDELQKEFTQRYVSDITKIEEKKSGYIVELKVTEIDISSSDIRQRVARNDSISGLVPAAVEGYIKKHGLYQRS